MKRKNIKVRAGKGTILYIDEKRFYRAQIMIAGEHLRRSFHTEEDAQAWLADTVRRSFKYGMSPDKAKITFADLAEMFMEAKETEGLKKTTLQDYRNTISILNCVWGKTPVQHLLPEHIHRLLTTLKKGGLKVKVTKTVWESDPATGKKLKLLKEVETVKPAFAPKYLRNIHGTIHTILEYAFSTLEIADRNACDKVKPPKAPEGELSVWDEQSLQRFLAGIADTRTEALLWVLATTGMRKGELVGLKWADIDITTGDITIQRRVVRLARGEGIDIAAPKSRAGNRVVTLPEPALVRIRSWRQQQILERAAADSWRDEDWVFTTRTGNHVEPRWINHHLDETITRLGLPHLTVHGLRHTFCTWLLRQNVPIKDVSEIVGHSKPTVTLNLYWKSIPGANKRVGSKLGELLGANLATNWPPERNEQGAGHQKTP